MAEGREPTSRSRVRFGERVRYLLDSVLSRGTWGLLLLAVAGSALVLLAVTPILWMLRAWATDRWAGRDFAQLYWRGMSRLFSFGEGTGDWFDQLARLSFALVAIFFTGVVLGSIVKAIDIRLGFLRETGGPIVATGHTVVAGWSPLGPVIVGQVAAMGRTGPRTRIAVLTQIGKVEMEGRIGRLHLPNTTPLVRRGDPAALHDLALVRPERAREIIVLSEWGSGDHDTAVITQLLALARYRERHPGFDVPVVGCVMDGANEAPAIVASDGHATVISAQRMLAHVMVRVARQPGLFAALSSLCSMEDQRFAICAVPEVAGRRFGDLVDAYAAATVAGLFRDGGVLLLPPEDLVIEPSDELVVLLPESMQHPVLAKRSGSIDEAAIVVEPSTPDPARSEDWLFIGWGDSIPHALSMLDGPAGSVECSATILVPEKDESRARVVEREERGSLTVTVTTWHRDTSLRDVLLQQDLTSRTHVVIPSHREGAHRSDAFALIALLQVRDILGPPTAGVRQPAVIAELLDHRYRDIADAPSLRSVTVGSDLVAMLMVQIARDPRLRWVFRTLLDRTQPEVGLRPASDYVTAGTPLTYLTVCAAAARRGEIALGLVVAAEMDRSDLGFGVHLNPDKGSVLTVAEGDQVLVLARTGDAGPVELRPVAGRGSSSG